MGRSLWRFAHGSRFSEVGAVPLRDLGHPVFLERSPRSFRHADSEELFWDVSESCLIWEVTRGEALRTTRNITQHWFSPTLAPQNKERHMLSDGVTLKTLPRGMSSFSLLFHAVSPSSILLQLKVCDNVSVSPFCNPSSLPYPYNITMPYN